MAYTQRMNQRDASYILGLWGEDGEAVPELINHLLTEGDHREAKGVLRAASAEELVQISMDQFKTFTTITALHLSVTAFQAFINRFRSGVVDSSLPHEPPVDNSHPEHDQRDSRQDRLRSRESRPPPARETRYGTIESFPRRRHVPPTQDTHTDHRAEQCETLYNNRKNQVKADDLKYDGTTPVTTYVKRLEFLATQYGDGAILQVLPLAMRGDASDWLNSLSSETFTLMNSDLVEWQY